MYNGRTKIEVCENMGIVTGTSRASNNVGTKSGEVAQDVREILKTVPGISQIFFSGDTIESITLDPGACPIEISNLDHMGIRILQLYTGKKLTELII